MFRKHFLRAAAVTVAVGSTLLTATGFASASVAGAPVVADSGCAATEFTRIIDGHDHMFVNPTAYNGWCVYEIWDDNAGRPAYRSTSPAGNQPAPNGVYDGPGVLLQVVVIDTWNGAQAEGPTN